MVPSQRRTWLFGPGADPRAHERRAAGIEPVDAPRGEDRVLVEGL